MNHPNHQPSREGSAFILVVAVLVILMSLSIALTDTTVSASQESTRRKDEVALNVTAESMTNLAMRHLQGASLATAKANPTTRYDISTEVKTLAANDITSYLGGLAGGLGRQTSNGMDVQATWGLHGSYAGMKASGDTDIYRLLVTVADNGPARLYDAGGTQKAITNINKYRRQRIEVLYTTVEAKYFTQAMYAYDGYEWTGSAKTWSWNSGNGSWGYASGLETNNGDITSGQEIEIDAGKRPNVHGDVKENVPLPATDLTYDPPVGYNLPMVGDFTVSAGPLATGTYRTKGINLDDNSSSTITFVDESVVTIYVDGPVIFGKKNDFIVPPKCTVTIIQNDYDPALGESTLNGKTALGCLSNPGAFRWISLSKQTADKANGTADIGGVFFWPYATIRMNGNAKMYGSLVAKSFDAKVNGTFDFYYDDSLGNITLPLAPALVVVGWRSFPVGFSKDQDDDQ